MEQIRKRLYLFALIVGVLAVFVFLPCLQNDFVTWDDYANFVENPYYRGLAWDNLYWMFTTFHMGHYIPITWITLGLDYLLWDMNPAGYHLTNVLLHSANTILFFFVSRCLIIAASPKDDADAGDFRASRWAMLSTIIFSLHPLRVESVAWVTERRDLMSGIFILFTILFYFKAQETNAIELKRKTNSKWLAIAFIAYVFSLLSKSIGLGLPLILLVLDWYPLQRIVRFRDFFSRKALPLILEKIPFLLVTAIFIVITGVATRHSSSLATLSQHGVSARIAQVALGLNFYLSKTLLPTNLSPLYEIPLYWEPWSWVSVGYIMTALFLTVSFILLARRRPILLACWLSYILFLLPVLGIVHGGQQFVADRYSYLACGGWSIFLGILLGRLQETGVYKTALFFSHMIILLVLIGTLSALTTKQISFWKDTKSLWGRVLSVNPSSFTAHNGLGAVLMREGEATIAAGHFKEAIRLNPYYAMARSNMGMAFAQQGQIEKAVNQYKLAIRLDRKLDQGYYNLANALNSLGLTKGAVVNYRRAIAINPDYVKAHYNLGNALIKLGNDDQAIFHYKQAIRVEENFAQAHYNLGVTYLKKGIIHEALEQFQITVRLNPKHDGARNNLRILERL